MRPSDGENEKYTKKVHPIVRLISPRSFLARDRFLNIFTSVFFRPFDTLIRKKLGKLTRDPFNEMFASWKEKRNVNIKKDFLTSR